MARTDQPLRIGCVGFVNARPLVRGLDAGPDALSFDVPSALIARLEAGEIDAALCPVVDYFRSPLRPVIVPVGAIGCDGPTLTVRLFSRCPIPRVRELHADTDSHTSVALSRIILRRLTGRRPRVIDFNARERVAENRPLETPETMLLIGDKVVTDAPDEGAYPYQLDLGAAWKRLTGMPFVFATWLARPNVDLGALPARLEAARQAGLASIDHIVAEHAVPRGWPAELAGEYLGRLLRYEFESTQARAIATFAAAAAELDLIPEAAAPPAPLRIYPDARPLPKADAARGRDDEASTGDAALGRAALPRDAEPPAPR